MNTEVLTLKWTTSRGRDTYGYNILTLRNERGEVVGRCMGGGYDMVGTVFGMWLEDNYQLTVGCGYHPGAKPPTTATPVPYRVIRKGLDQIDVAEFYGATQRPDGTVRLDGACGIESMLRIAKALGFDIQRMRDRRGNTTGWVVQS